MCVKITRKCSNCKEEFRKDILIEYSSLSGKTSHWFCPKCYEEKMSREKFADSVCKIFGIKSPGPRIWADRKAIIDKYGYTDDTIIDCLEYAYNILGIKKLSESLYFVKPDMVEKMKAWKRGKKEQAAGIATSIATTEMVEHIVPINEKKKERKEVSLEDGLFDD